MLFGAYWLLNVVPFGSGNTASRTAWLLGEQYRRRGEGYELQATSYYADLQNAARAIMTTDTLPKATADRVQRTVRDEWGRGLITRCACSIFTEENLS